MGKNYAESSLKHYLKQKVRITLGLVVTFLITGAFAFAGEEQKEIETAKKYLAGLGTEINLDKEITAGKAKISSDGAGGIKITFDNKEVSVSKDIISAETGKVIQNSLNLINGRELSAIEDKEYNKGFNLKDNGTAKKVTVTDEKTGESWEEMQVSGVGNVYVNEGVLEYRQAAKDGAVIVNKGIIAHDKSNGQIIEESTGYNYGIIANNEWTGQKIGGKTKLGTLYGGTGYNYGIIANTGSIGQQVFYGEGNNYGIIATKGDTGQALHRGGELNNYGIIANGGQFGQAVYEASPNETDKKSVVNNYGVIANKSQYGQTISYGEGYNYGVIANKGNYGQQATKGGKVYNYGTIANTGNHGLSVSNNSEGYNYGIIANKGAWSISNLNGKAENYGVIKTSIIKKEQNKIETGPIFSSPVDNYGIILTDIETTTNEKGERVPITEHEIPNAGLGTGKNKDRGVVLDKNYNLFVQNKAWKPKVNLNVIDLNKKADGERLIKDEATETADINEETYFIKNGTAEIVENLNDDVLNAVVTKDATNTTVFKYTGDEKLVLNNSQIIGYFENDGTLLEVEKDLTLEGNYVINAIAGNKYTGYTGEELKDVVAVKLADNGTLTLNDNSKVLGAVKGNGTLVFTNNKDVHDNLKETDSAVIKTTAGETTNIALSNLKLKDSGIGVNNAGKLVIDNQSDKKLEGKDVSTSITLANNINIQNGIDGSSSANGIELILGDGQISSDETIKIGGEVLLGQADDTIIINNILGKYEDKAAVINGNEGRDTVNLKNSNGKHDIFDYTLKNIETLDLGNSSWKIGTNASISHDTVIKAGEKTTIQNGTLVGELQGTAEKGVDFVNNDAVNKVIGNSTFGDNAKFQMNIGKDMVLKAGAEYDMEDTAVNNLANNVGEKNITTSGIFAKATEQGKDIRVKSAEEMKINGKYSEIYEEMLENASSNEEILNVLNNSSASEIADTINSKGALGDTLATTGYKITRDITNSFMSAVNEWDKKANKGEWLANAKYISSDVEYDGANNVKGYDSDINSMVGMIEYGVSENTSYGIALGGGDTEVDVKGAGTLEGDNYYIGAYAKHSVNGFDLVGNLGYTISDLDVDGKGSADSSAVTLGGYIKKDIALTETIRLEPNFAFTYDYIMQDNAEGNGVKVDNKDIHVFEATVGMNIVKGFNIEKGILELKTGVKYSMADINRNEETIISVYEKNINLGDPEVDKTRGTAHVGFDYEHETGFGVNGKYEMM